MFLTATHDVLVLQYIDRLQRLNNGKADCHCVPHPIAFSCAAQNVRQANYHLRLPDKVPTQY